MKEEEAHSVEVSSQGQMQHFFGGDSHNVSGELRSSFLLNFSQPIGSI
jgi:hypothetical protein